MADVRGLLAQLGFNHISLDVAGRYSIADLFPSKNHRCGIYVLHFADGEYYVGQSIDVVRRYAQHCLTFRDITWFSFMPIDSAGLTTREEAVIRALEGLGEHLRNRQIVEFSWGDTRLGTLLKPEDLHWWSGNAGNSFIDLERTDQEDQRRRYARELINFQQIPFASTVIDVARAFVQSTIPAPNATEAKFWSVTRPSRSREVYLRVNVGAQQTFAIVLRPDNIPAYDIFLPRQSIATLFPEIDDFPDSEGVEIGEPNSPQSFVIWFEGQRAGGFRDQVVLEATSAEAIRNLLSDEEIICACRRFHVGLMQKGPCLWAVNHVYSLADRLLEPQLP